MEKEIRTMITGLVYGIAAKEIAESYGCDVRKPRAWEDLDGDTKRYWLKRTKLLAKYIDDELISAYISGFDDALSMF